MSDELRYPIGPFRMTERLSPDDRAEALSALEEAPDRMRDAVSELSDARLDTPYREGGWTVRQVVHHVPDSHLNGYVRLRWALTEDTPTIKAYEQALWAELPDARTAPVAPSLDLLEAVHDRFVRLFRALDEDAFARRFRHPEGWAGTVDTLLALYAWHGRHHVGHIMALRGREGW